RDLRLDDGGHPPAEPWHPASFSLHVVAVWGPRLPGAVQPRPPSDSRSELSRWMGVGDANNSGNVHGGVIMYLCDEVAGIAAVRHSGGRVVTVAMDRMTFLTPVL